MGRPKKDGNREVFHLGGWNIQKLRGEANLRDALLGDVATEVVEAFYAHLDMRHIDLKDLPLKSAVNLRLSPEARRMLDEICQVTGVGPSPAMSMILLWAYLTQGEDSSITDYVT